MPVALGIAVMLVALVWVCLEMAGHAQGGDALLITIFGSAAAGAVAATAVLLCKR